MVKSKRIAITSTDFWERVILEFREAHPSRVWPDATVITHFAELGYLSWVSGSSGSSGVGSRTPTVSAFRAPYREGVPVAADDGFPFTGFE